MISNKQKTKNKKKKVFLDKVASLTLRIFCFKSQRGNCLSKVTTLNVPKRLASDQLW